MSEVKNIPRLRFSEFEYEWTTDTLNSISNINMGQSPNSSSYNEDEIGIPLIQGNADIINRKSKPRQWTTEPTKLCDDGDLIMTVRAPVGYISKSIHNACIGRGVCSIKPKKNNSIEFIYQFLLGYEKDWRRLEQGSTFTAVNSNDIKSIKLSFPSLPEQRKISDFLTAVDKRIELLEKKKEQLELYKKGVMQKIFSQEIRFKDNNSNEFPDWEGKKLEDVFYSKKGSGLSGKNIVSNGKNKCILYGALYTKYDEVVDNVVESTNEEGSVKSQIGDILVPASTTTTGIDLANFTAINLDGVLLGGDITILRFFNEGCNIFWSYYLTHFKKYEIAKFAQGSTIVHIYFSHFGKTLIKEPSVKEQEKIAEFLKSIDCKIKSVSTQIEKTKEFKKGLLQQMFI